MSNQKLLGQYEVLDKIGEGGMGQVWKALDTRLNRTVAIKVLSRQFLEDPEFRQRFQREARAISGLSHPNICTLYDIGEQNGIPFLVMEYLNGPTLAARLQEGAIPVADALRHATEIAEALDHAHRRNIVHRDLKPGNLLLISSGVRTSIKLLDFGLAKAVRPHGDTSGPAPATLTRAGVVMGTLSYMAPEQVAGKPVDTRTDIFSFGALFYEMLTGAKAFRGDSESAIMAAVLSADPPPVTTLSPVTPRELDRVVMRCLQKNPDARYQSTRDVLAELAFLQNEAAASQLPSPAATVPQAPPPAPRGKLRLAYAVAALCLIAAAGFAAWSGFLLGRPRPTSPGVQFSLGPPLGESFPFGAQVGGSAISPDGSVLAFVATSRGVPALWTRRLDSLEARVVPGSEGAAYPFWAPDGRSLAFFASGKLKRADLQGGAILELADAPSACGGTWSPAGTIVFAPDASGRLYQLPDTGGKPSPVSAVRTRESEDAHCWPQFLPGGRRFLYLSRRVGREGSRIAIGSLDGNPESQKPVDVASSNYRAQYSPSGNLLFVRDGTLLAQPFDPERGSLSGEPRTLSSGIALLPHLNYACFSVSNGDVLLTRSGGVQTSQLAWFDRSGRRLEAVGSQELYIGLRLSDDGARLVTARTDARTAISDLWLHDMAAGTSARVTFEDGRDFSPVWSGDASTLAFASTRTGVANLYARPAAGTGGNRLLLQSVRPQRPFDWSADGRHLLYEESQASTKRDLWALPLSEGGKPFAVINSGANESQGRFSPDGRWVAYSSDESGRSEIYVRDFPASGAQWQVSTQGGAQPVWRSDGRELFYIASDGSLVAVPITVAGTALRPGATVRLFKAGLPVEGWSDQRYDVSRDGQRFLLLTTPESAATPALVVTMGRLGSGM